MATSLAKIRERLQQQEANRNKPATKKDNGIYPHWEIPVDATASLRFLPDGDSKNDFFWVERLVINLPFPGIKNQPESRPVTVKVPCVDMWEPNSCPILAEVRPWFKDPALHDLGKKYWKKRSYILQGFVRKNPLADDETPENPIRRFIMSPSIFGMIKAAVMDPELEELPTDYVRGLDFHVTKTQKGGKYSDYSTSKWSRKESPLTEEELEAIEEHGLFNLSDFLPKRPSDTELAVMKDMFEASVNGDLYDLEKWGHYFKPFGVSQNKTDDDNDDSDTTETEAKASAKAAKVEEETVEEAKTTVKETTVAKAGSRAEEILAAIKKRNQTQK